jgi:class 3 adenylate cyclase
VTPTAIVVAAVHVPEAWLSDAAARVPEACAATVLAAIRAIGDAGGRVELATPQLVIAMFGTPTEAIEGALGAAHRVAAQRLVDGGEHAHLHLAVGLGFGPVVAVAGDGIGGHAGAELSRAWRLACVAHPGEVLCTEAVRGAVSAPVGVGMFRAPAIREALAGFSAHVLVDYRE